MRTEPVGSYLPPYRILAHPGEPLPTACFQCGNELVASDQRILVTRTSGDRILLHVACAAEYYDACGAPMENDYIGG